jgi:hypothetical protein
MSPLDEYLARQAKWSAQQQLAQRAFIAIGNWRLFTAVAAAVLAWFAFGQGTISGWWLLAPGVIFIALVIWHQRVLRRRTFAERGIRFYQQAIHRVQDNWSDQATQGKAFQDANHIYADDLDIFGRGSLFELLCSARTAAGEQTLASWLLAPASLQEASARQQAVRELAPKLDLREEMALLGEDIKSSINAELLATWGSAPPVVFPPILRIASLCLAGIGLLALILKLADVWPPWPLVLILGINAIIMFLFRKQTVQVHGAIESAAHQLGLLSLLVNRIERETFTSAGLAGLRNDIITDGIPASRRIKHLDRWLEMLDSSDHIVLRILEPLVLYKHQIVMAIEAWRTRNGQAIGKWIQALAEFEALSCLGALHYERPAWAFPQLEASPSAHFAAANLGHPLLASSVAVRNSLNLDQDCRLLIVSGSNMSGKSTLLRAVGLNTVLAWAGAPVCAESLRLSPLQVGASLRVSDSLQDNRSRFFAEISRLRQIVDLTKGMLPVLFLLDELLSGTNSHDRRIGAAAIVRGLLAANSVGLLTTHDLALAQLDQDAGAPAQNVHFEDRIIDGKIEFDYHLRPGVVTHSNALELMRSIGLEI